MERPILQVLFIETLAEASERYRIERDVLEQQLAGKTQRVRGDQSIGYYSPDIAAAVAVIRAARVEAAA